MSFSPNIINTAIPGFKFRALPPTLQTHPVVLGSALKHTRIVCTLEVNHGPKFFEVVKPGCVLFSFPLPNFVACFQSWEIQLSQDRKQARKQANPLMSLTPSPKKLKNGATIPIRARPDPEAALQDT